MEFTELNLIDQLIKALKQEGYSNPTPIQEQAIPVLMQGRDLMGIAQTGTGKTAAFLLPMLQHLTEKNKIPPTMSPRALILAPTRELAAQIGASCKAYGRFLHITHTVIFGGVGQVPQVKALQRGVDILVATPGRLLDLMEQGFIKLDHVEFFVLDEADRMLDMGFIHDVKRIVTKLPEKRQTLCFSATMSKDVEQLARTMLHDPAHVAVTPQATTVEKTQQRVLFVDQENKDELLTDILRQEGLQRVLVFTRTKHRANKVTKHLNNKKIDASAIHGNKSQAQRTLALKEFQKGIVRVLVATDIAARGIDVEGISHVINYDLPNEPESYVHRIGRTARAGAEGTAYSFCASDERGYLDDIEKLIRQKIPILDHPRHSDRAMNSRGAESRSAHVQRPRGQGGFRRGGSGRGHGERSGGRSQGGRSGQRSGPRGSGGPRGPRTARSGSGKKFSRRK